MKRQVSLWMNLLIALTVVILLVKSYLILAGPIPPGTMGLQLCELAGRNAAMIAASVLAIITQRVPFFQTLCVMGLVRETWDAGNVIHFSGFGPDAYGLLGFSVVWGAALWSVTRQTPLASASGGEPRKVTKGDER